MFDLVKLRLEGGDGGNGRVSFYRAKFISKGGPDGGNGGHGGSIYFQATSGLNTLQHFSGVKEFKAEAGQPGGKQQMFGHRGEDLIIEVPVGTIVWVLADNKTSRKRRLYPPREGKYKVPVVLEQYKVEKPTNTTPPPREADELRIVSTPGQTEELDSKLEEVIFRSDSLKNINLQDVPKVKLVELNEDGQKVLIAEGGIGGRGNESFKGSTNTTPLQAEYGSYGEKKIILLELRLLADVGLVGYPNAGKSTLLSIVTKANPKIANYPFTTIEPNLGVMSYQDKNQERDIILADIPGLIEGASEGKGLGYDFLRHIQGCKVLLFVLSLDEEVLFDEDSSEESKAEALYLQYQVLRKELEQYSASMLEKPTIVSVSKADLYSDSLKQHISDLFQKHGMKVLFISSITQSGIQELKQSLFANL
jgi:GTP-binding protein